MAGLLFNRFFKFVEGFGDQARNLNLRNTENICNFHLRFVAVKTQHYQLAFFWIQTLYHFFE